MATDTAELALKTSQDPPPAPRPNPTGSGTNGAGRDRGPEPDVEPEDPREFILGRELSEVYLLLDYISACPSKALPASLSDPAPQPPTADWLTDICQISWPPPQTPKDKADQAALLIRAKDRLNRLAAPASGATIAFTLLVAQEDPDKPDPSAGGRTPAHAIPSRASLATTAFPALASQARTFRWRTNAINLCLVIWLVLTCLLSWYVTMGLSLLSQLSLAQTSQAAAEQKLESAEAGVTAAGAGATLGAGASTVAADPVAAPTAAERSDPVVPYCQRPLLLKGAPLPNGGLIKQYHSTTEFHVCEQKDKADKDLKVIEFNLMRWLRIRPVGGAVRDDLAPYASSLAGLLGGAVLPVFYGILGAGASVVRAISRKTRHSRLSPRDFPLSLQQLALGAVVGACIGLFVNSPTTGTAAGATLLGPVALSSSALSFIAGFGVEGVFRAMEAFITRVFGGGSGQSPPAPAEG
jgi:hypothetical protein